MNILIDTNFILDFLTEREPFFVNSDKIIQMCKTDELTGYIAAHSILNSFYILRKVYSVKERRDMLFRFIKITSVVGVGENKITKALLREDFKDFEDCLQDECAVSCGAEYIITRNVEDFVESKVKAITPDDFLRLME